MYDAALLDDIDDESTPQQDATALAEKPVDPATGAEMSSNTQCADDSPADADGDESQMEPEANDSWSDDPVRMYLTQMGEIPLLTRSEEISLAKRIETTRSAFRCKLLECSRVRRRTRSGPTTGASRS